MATHRWMLLCYLLALPAVAMPDDLVVLSSGNRMTGTVRELTRGELGFSIDGVGRVDIDWKNVTQLESKQRLDIEVASGERLIGTISSPSPGTLEITTDTGPRELAMVDIVRMYPIAATFAERTEGFVDLGLDFLSADDEIDWTFNAEARNRTENYRTDVLLSSLLRRHDGATTQRRNDLAIGVRRFLSNRWFGIGLFAVEEDRELDLDLRALAGAALGRTLVQSSRGAFAIYGGLDLVHEEYRGASSDDRDDVEALASVEWDAFHIAANFDLAVKATTYVVLDDGRVRFDLDGSLRRDISDNIYVSLNVFESYNSDPPNDLEKSDFGVSLALGRTF